MGERTTPLKFPKRRADFDVLARVAANPRGVLILYRGKRYCYVRCAGCRAWYWRIYSVRPGGFRVPGKQLHAYCSEPCRIRRAALLLKARHERFYARHPHYRAPSRR